MGAANMYVDDLSTSEVHESTSIERGTQTIADFSLLSGIAHLAVNPGSCDDAPMGQEDASIDPLNAGIIPAGEESSSSDIEAEVSFPFEDSITLWLASRHNESQIVTINTSDSSANISGLLLAILNPDGNDDDEGPGVAAVGGAIGGANVVNMSTDEGRPDPTLEEDSGSSFYVSCVNEDQEAGNEDTTSHKK